MKDLSYLPPAPPLSRRYNEEFHWMLENMNVLTEVYPDQWVAIVDKQVVAVGKTRGEVQNATRKKINSREFLLYFIEGETYVYSN